jgi:hypothetical protein
MALQTHINDVMVKRYTKVRLLALQRISCCLQQALVTSQGVLVLCPLCICMRANPMCTRVTPCMRTGGHRCVCCCTSPSNLLAFLGLPIRPRHRRRWRRPRPSRAPTAALQPQQQPPRQVSSQRNGTMMVNESITAMMTLYQCFTSVGHTSCVFEPKPVSPLTPSPATCSEHPPVGAVTSKFEGHIAELTQQLEDARRAAEENSAREGELRWGLQ